MRRLFLRIKGALLFAAVIALLVTIYAVAGGEKVFRRGVDVTSSGAAADGAPIQHPSVPLAADLEGARAEAVYRSIVDAMVDIYAASGELVTRRYRSWYRYNRFPYRSGPHGGRLVNIYANSIAHDRGLSRQGRPMPAGALIAKDSFVITETGNIFTGSFFLMEKLPDGTSPGTNDWRYLMIDTVGTETDGSLVNLTEQAAQRCHACHVRAPAGQDHLFLPMDERAPQ